MDEQPLDVIGVGALNVDKLYLVNKIAQPGQEVAIKSMVEAPGGSSANTIVGLSRLGIETGFIGNVGNDTEGEYLINDFRKENVDTNGIHMSHGLTGIVIGFIDNKGERTLYANPGLNDHLNMDDQALEYAKRAKISETQLDNVLVWFDGIETLGGEDDP